MVGRIHDLQQPGIDKFLGALRQYGVKSNELNGQSLHACILVSQRMYGFLKGHQDLRNTSLSSSMMTLVNLTMSLNTHILTFTTLILLRQKQNEKTKNQLTSKLASDLGTSQLFRLATNLKFFSFINLFYFTIALVTRCIILFSFRHLNNDFI